MYTNDNCKILNENYEAYIDYYKNAFQMYFIQIFYGSNIIMGNTLVKDDENGK